MKPRPLHSRCSKFRFQLVGRKDAKGPGGSELHLCFFWGGAGAGAGAEFQKARLLHICAQEPSGK